MNARFLESKIKRSLKENGNIYTFVRKKVDKYSTKTNEITNCFKIKGLMHISTSYAKRSEQDSSITTKKNSPMILCLIKDAECLEVGDETVISCKKYEIVHLENVGNLNVAYDISLEEKRNE